MYYNLNSALKRRLILELQDIFSRHPVYEKVCPNIQSSFSFAERPQFGIVVKGSASNKVTLSGDNFLGTVLSHSMLSYLKKPAYLLEWVRDDLAAIRANGGVVPTLPGVYYIECLKAPTNVNEVGRVAIDPLLTVSDEPLWKAESGQLPVLRTRESPVRGTLRLWENSRYLMVEGEDYRVEWPSGTIQMLTTPIRGSLISADYRYPGKSFEAEFRWQSADATTLPGVVLAYGKRAREREAVAVVVTPDLVDTARAYGGKSELSYDLTVIAMDPNQVEEIADFAYISLLGEKKSALEFEGIELVDISSGGEAEETYDEVGDILSYTVNLSVQLRADWEIHEPFPLVVKQASLTEDFRQVQPSDLFFSTHSTIVGRGSDFERIR